MGKNDVLEEVTNAVENGGSLVVKEGESMTEKKAVGKNSVEEMEEDSKDDEKVEDQKLDVVKEEAMEVDAEEGEEPRSEAMEVENGIKLEEVEDKGKNGPTLSEDEGNAEKDAAGKVSKRKRSKTKPKSSGGKGESKKMTAEEKKEEPKTPGEKAKSKKTAVEEKKEEPKTPVALAMDRPVRERKSVERLVAIIEKDPVKINIEQGRGTALKDIPNVAYKLSRKKKEETFKLLYTILFGRRGKASQIKSHISQFSGFVWHEHEEKQKNKVKEKLDKLYKEKLWELCDVLDLPISTSSRKEDIITKMMDFLEAPHATTGELLAEKEQSGKSQKRKRSSKNSPSTPGTTPSRSSAKSRSRNDSAIKGDEKKSSPGTEEEHEEEQENDNGPEGEENVEGVSQGSEDENPEHVKSGEKEAESEVESEEETRKQKQGSDKSSAKRSSSEKTKSKRTAKAKKSSLPAKKTPPNPSASHSKVVDHSDTNPKTFSSKNKTEAIKEKSSAAKNKSEAIKEKSSPAPKKSASKEKAGKKVEKEKEKPKEKLKPNDSELKNAICEILKEVDFNTATFTDILRQLVERFKTDLVPRKASIKLMIQEELTKLADEADDDDDDGNEDVVGDDKQASVPAVKA